MFSGVTKVSELVVALQVGRQTRSAQEVWDELRQYAMRLNFRAIRTADPTAQPETEADPAAEADPVAEAKADPTAQPETDPAMQPEAQANPATTTQPEARPEATEAPTQPEATEAPTQPEAEATPEFPSKKKPRMIRVAPITYRRGGKTFCVIPGTAGLPGIAPPMEPLPAVDPPRSWDGRSGRVFISVGRHPVKTIISDMNSVVLDRDSFAVLAAAGPALSDRASGSALKARYESGQYDVYRAEDGTVMTLYPFGENDWGLSTCKGYDVSTLQWAGEGTWAGTLARVAANYPGMQISLAENGRIACGLSREYSYGLGVRSRDCHPLSSDPERMWLLNIQPRVAPTVAKVDVPIRLEAPSVEVPAVAPPAVEAIIAALGVPVQRPVASPPKYADLFVDNSVQALLKSREGAAAPAHHYGWVLRVKPEFAGGVGNYGAVLIESELMRAIRTFVYEPARDGGDPVLPGERMTYNAFRAYLGPDRALYEQIFNAGPLFRKFDAMVGRILAVLVNNYRNSELKKVITGSSGAPEAAAEPVDPAASVAIAMKRFIDAREKIPPFDKNLKSILEDWVVNPNNAKLFTRAYLLSC